MIELTPLEAGCAALAVIWFGACVGSFLNVCIYRIPRDESVVHPRSHCPACNRLIAWYDNIPLVSWWALRARCRHCRARISPRYILIEALTAILFLWIWLRFGLSAETLVYWLVTGGLILGTFVDFEHLILPDRVTLGGIVAGLACGALVPALHGQTVWWQGLLQAGLGAAFGAGLLGAVRGIGSWIFRKEAMGLGDVKLMGAIGAFFGWPGVLFTLVLSSFAGSLAGISLILAGRQQWQGRIPYGPYLALGALVWMLGGAAWWEAYLAWLTSAG
ncbi:MAG: prepilin peptidase [Candidatus Marinimicrobia bacterium]|nr:prepilin peptidase [Candidatus Neomarinimicrobiota bacterium]